MAPLASIVILAYGNRAASDACLTSLDRALGSDLGHRYELVLVDNDSPDDTLELFEAWADRATVVTLPENRNFSGGCNAGARASSGDVLVFLNNDTEVPRGAIEALVDQAQAPGVGIVGTRLLFPSGRIQHAGVVFRHWEGRTTPMHLFAHEPGELAAAAATYDLDAVTGACLVMRRGLFDDLGGFDEQYANGLEDVDLCVRTRFAGHRVVYRGDVAIVHHEKLTRGARHDDARNLAIFYERWQQVCDGDDELLADVFGARFTPRLRWIVHPQRDVAGSAIAVTGEVELMSPEAAEGRALIWLADASGAEPALRDGPQPLSTVLPKLDDDLLDLLERTRRRPIGPGALELHVPPPRRVEPGAPGALLRVGEVPRQGLRDDHCLLVPSRALRQQLVDAGVPASRIDVLPPPVRPTEVGVGGSGVLALMAADDPARCERIADALSSLDAPLTLLPNVRTEAIRSLAELRLPHARLLRPVTDEREYARLAGEFELVLTAGDSDPFERRTLIAAAGGAAVVPRCGGPAEEIVGPGQSLAPTFGADELRTVAERALTAPGRRLDRAARVVDTCAPDALGPRLRDILAARRPDPVRIVADDLDRAPEPQPA